MKLKIFKPANKTPSSQLVKEGAILVKGAAGNSMLVPGGDTEWVREFDKDISAVFEAGVKELATCPDGYVLMATEN